MASIEVRTSKAGAVTYRVKVRRKGCSHLSKTFMRKTDAKQYAQKIESDINQGVHKANALSERKTLADAVDRYIQFVLPKKPKSQSKQAVQLRWWKEQAGHLKLCDVDPAVVAELRESLTLRPTRQGAATANATVNRYLAALSHMFTIAIKEWGWLEANPCSKVSKLTEPRGRVRFLSDSERDDLLHVCKQSPNPYLYIVVLIALSTGARYAEIMGLTRHDVDLKQNLLIFRDTKNGSTRSVPLQYKALECITAHLKVRNLNTAHLFPSTTNPNKPMDIRKAWQRALTLSGVENFLFHDLRHTAASYLTMSGASLIEVAEILGHRTLSMVQRYSHLSKKHLEGVIERMNEKMNIA